MDVSVWRVFSTRRHEGTRQSWSECLRARVSSVASPGTEEGVPGPRRCGPSVVAVVPTRPVGSSIESPTHPATNQPVRSVGWAAVTSPSPLFVRLHREPTPAAMRLLRFQSRSGRIQRLLPLMLFVLVSAAAFVRAAPQDEAVDGDYDANYEYDTVDEYDYEEGTPTRSQLRSLFYADVSPACFPCCRSRGFVRINRPRRPRWETWASNDTRAGTINSCCAVPDGAENSRTGSSG